MRHVAIIAPRYDIGMDYVLANADADTKYHIITRADQLRGRTLDSVVYIGGWENAFGDAEEVRAMIEPCLVRPTPLS